MYYWLMLLAAIVTEVASTSFMKLAAEQNPWLGYSAMAVLISLSYYCLAQAVRKIPLALAYTMWEGIGLLLISGISWLFFHETFSTWKLVAIGCLLTGLVLMNLGEKLAEKSDDRERLENNPCSEVPNSAVLSDLSVEGVA
ncbi:DMT family transporter [Kistimonas asteriae]|uniref:DMT family transporter n=1 Tax=Kistimonas asteriae TaxID=517724 RepID=UPI001BA975A3|nr:SMR family transporter [Kistimonas asteriae]